jgi:hypothetical protein
VKSIIAVLGFISILLVVVFASGCTSNEKILYEYNLSTGQSPTYIGVQNVTVPNGTNNIKVEAQDLEKVNSNLNTSYVNIYALSSVPVTVTVNGNDTTLVKDYNASVLLQKNFDLTKETGKTFSYTFNDANIKGFIITNVNAKGLVKIITS